jgi:hypothetical protein
VSEGDQWPRRSDTASSDLPPKDHLDLVEQQRGPPFVDGVEQHGRAHVRDEHRPANEHGEDLEQQRLLLRFSAEWTFR